MIGTDQVTPVFRRKTAVDVAGKKGKDRIRQINTVMAIHEVISGDFYGIIHSVNLGFC